MVYTAQELRNAFWADDAAQGGLIRSQYEQIKRVLAEKDLNWVLEQYRELKQHAIEQTDFYKDLTVDDEFPVVNKSVLLANYERCKAKGGFDGPIHISSTSGSTGTPFAVPQDLRKRKRNIADLKVFGERCDYPSHERMVFFRVLSEKLHRTKEQEDRENIYYIDSACLDSAHLEQMRRVIVDKQPRIIFSYASTLVELAKYTEAACGTLDVPSLQAVLTAGEGISEENRRLLERVFGATVYRRYSDMEMGILGQDMGGGGAYALNYGSYYFECLKQDRDEPTEPGEVGRIVITDLFNYAFPMIRYDTGDLGIMDRDPNSGFGVLREIYGRSRDCVYATDGALISPAKIFVSMWGAEGIRQWQFVQQTRTGYVLKLNCDDNLDTGLLIRRFQDILGQDADIRVENVEEIPVLSSNKRRAVICNYDRNAVSVEQVQLLAQKREIIEACDHAFSNPVSRRECYESLLAKIHAHGEFLAAYRQGPAGYLAMYANDTVGKTAYVTLLAVKPECQKLRIGSSLMEAGFALARQRGMKQMKLEVNAGNIGAIALYERLGFVRLCEAGEQSLYMIKDLDEK